MTTGVLFIEYNVLSEYNYSLRGEAEEHKTKGHLPLDEGLLEVFLKKTRNITKTYSVSDKKPFSSPTRNIRPTCIAPTAAHTLRKQPQFPSNSQMIISQNLRATRHLHGLQRLPWCA